MGASVDMHTFLLKDSFLDGSAHCSQVLAKGQGRRELSLRQVVMKTHLGAQGSALADAFGLAALGIADGFGKSEDVLCSRGGEKEDAVIITQHQIPPRDRPCSYHRRLQRLCVSLILPLGSGGDRSQTEDRQANFLQ